MKAIDRIARRLGERSTRRDVMKAASLTAVGAAIVPGGGISLAQEATPEPSAEDVQFMFVQTASNGTLAANPGAGTPTAAGGADYLLTLEGHTGQTVYFSDRPERITGVAPTDAFLEGLGFTPVNPPNAALVIQGENGEDIIVVLELLSPEHDDDADTITYGAEMLEEYEGIGLDHLASLGTDGDLPESFGPASLFIDDCPDVGECYSTAMRGVPIPVGKVPGGPYGRCWSWTDLACLACSSSSPSIDELNKKCNEEYAPDCGNNDCYAGP